jgi:APA family basic amino acid/polyamine antiporter
VKKRVGIVAVVGLMYATACGGPYGMEDFVAKVGPGVFILLLVAAPWMCGVPTALATAELSTRHAVAGGYYRWTCMYLGPFWGYQTGLWSLIGSFLDNALYPVLFARALVHYFPGMTALGQWLAAVAFILVLTYLNHRGIQIAGATAVALNVVLVAPLLWLVVAAAAHVRFNPVLPFMAPGDQFWSGFGANLALAIWLYSGYYEVSAAAEEIERPERTIPMALLVLTPIVVLTYALPMLAGLAAVGGWETWTSGEFVAMGQVLGGPVLGNWLFLGSVASQAVIFLSYLVWWSRLSWAMAADRHLPQFLTRTHPRFGTPSRILWIYAAIYSVMAALPFEDLLVADIWNYGATNVLLQAALIRSRQLEGVPQSGFRTPGGTFGVWLIAVVPTLTWILLLVFTAREHWLLGSAVLVCGPVFWAVERFVRRGETPVGLDTR